MKKHAFLALAAVSLLGVACSSQSTQGGSSETPTPTATVAEPATTTPKPEDKPGEQVQLPDAPTPGAGTDAPPAGGGRLAFNACTPEARAQKGCTKELQPVCGQVDTGIRCVKAPCPSTEQRTFPNSCTACQDAKVTGYFARSCEDIASGKAP